MIGSYYLFQSECVVNCIIRAFLFCISLAIALCFLMLNRSHPQKSVSFLTSSGHLTFCSLRNLCYLFHLSWVKLTGRINHT